VLETTLSVPVAPISSAAPVDPERVGDAELLVVEVGPEGEFRPDVGRRDDEPEGDGDKRVRDGGSLCDIAPTMLELLGIEAPSAMTGEPLVERDIGE